MRMKIALAVLLIAAAARLGFDHAFGLGGGGIPLRKPLKEFPVDAAGWTVREAVLTAETIDKAAVSDHLSRTYQKHGVRFSVYVGYYNGSTVDSIHHPEVCFPGGGFEPVSSEVVTYPGAAFSPLRFNRVVFDKRGLRRLTAYTFYYHGRYEPDQEVLYRGRAFSSRYYAVISVSADFPNGDLLERSQELMGELISVAVPRLEAEHFPAEPRERP